MRALAATYVVGHHLWQFAVSSGQAPPKLFQVFSVFKHGSYAVAVFLVVSGYCLMTPIARQQVARLQRGFGPFPLRRARHLRPASFGVLIASIVLIVVVASLRSSSGTPWDISRPILTVGSIASHVFAIHNWFEPWRWSINAPMWSIALALSLALTALGLGIAYRWMVGLFAVGVVAAQMTVAGRQRSSRDWAWLAIVGVAVVAASVAAELIHNQMIESSISEVVVGFATAVTIVVLASRGDAGSDSSGVSMAGALSWGRYALWVARRWGIPMWLLALTVLSAPVIAAVTAAMFYSVERPFLHRPTKHTDPVAGNDEGRCTLDSERRRFQESVGDTPADDGESDTRD